MKTIKIFETADELIHAFQPARSIEDDSPFIPFTVSITQKHDGQLEFVGEGSSQFETLVTYYELLDRVLEIQGIHYVPSQSS